MKVFQLSRRDVEKMLFVTTLVSYRMPCPVCGIHYDENLIESHAAICGEVVHMSKVTTSDSKLFETLTEELSSMKEKIYADAAKYKVSILRKRFIETAMQNLVDIDYNNILNVIFIGEEGVDAGGLTREFFALLFSKSPVFENGAFSIDCDLLNDETFKQIGKAVAYSVLFGNQGPNCLSRYLVNYIIFGTIPKVEDIPEDELPMFVIQAIKDITEAEGNFSDLYATHGDMLETSGFKKIMNDSTKKDAIHALILHFGFYRFLPQTLQFVEGLKLHCVYDVLKNHGEEAIVYFINCETTSPLIDFFLPSFSLEADEKEDEEMIVYNLHYFVKKLERGKIVTSYINMVDMDCSAEKTLTIKDFLKAITGSPTLVKNLTNCLVQFNHTSTMCSTVNTCAPSITVNQVKKKY